MKKTRFFWLVCILAMHVAIGVTMGMYLFAFVMIVLNLAAFGVGMEFLSSRIVLAVRAVPRSFFRSSNPPRNAASRRCVSHADGLGQGP
jgi:hypothetical protein